MICCITTLACICWQASTLQHPVGWSGAGRRSCNLEVLGSLSPLQSVRHSSVSFLLHPLSGWGEDFCGHYCVVCTMWCFGVWCLGDKPGCVGVTRCGVGVALVAVTARGRHALCLSHAVVSVNVSCSRYLPVLRCVSAGDVCAVK